MVLFNYATKELTAKVVYYGPGLCGKTTNLQFIYDSLPTKAKGKMLSLATKTDRTLFFDFLPIDLGTIRGMKTKIQLYTVPGQVFYDTTRKLVLKGADGVVFVADSQEPMIDANIDSFENLITNLSEQNMDIRNMPHVIQLNKRDMKNAMPAEELNARINRFDVPYFEAVAPRGDGVFETLKGISKLVLKSLGRKYGLEEDNPDDARPAAPKPKVPSLPPRPKAAAPATPPPAAPKAQPRPPAEEMNTKPNDPVIDDFDEPLDIDDELDVGGDLDDIELIDDELETPDQLDFPDDDDDVIELDDETDFDDVPAPAAAANVRDEEPPPSIDDSEVIELDDGDPLDVEELDDMAEIAQMASGPKEPAAAPAPAPPVTAKSGAADTESIAVPVSIELPTALSGKPLRLQIDIQFVD